MTIESDSQKIDGVGGAYGGNGGVDGGYGGNGGDSNGAKNRDRYVRIVYTR